MCDIWKRKDGREFRAADLDRHSASIRELGVKHVVLTGGEPLLNRDLEVICGFFRDLSIRVTLLTTGLLLEKKVDVVAAGFDDIIISLDGPAEIHDQVRRVPGAFEAVRRGVSGLRERRPDMPISCRATVQKLNRTHLCATVSAARLLGLTSISFLAADVSSAAFNREEPWSRERENEIALNRAELFELEEELELLIRMHQKDIESGFIAENTEKLRRITTRFRERIDGTPPKAPLCNAPWVSAVFEIDGAIRPCFFHEKVGDASQMSLDEAINSPQALQFRASLEVKNNPTCQRCVCSLNYGGEVKQNPC
jgi:MoaA/NifB/PqqE/SkfB family radical SAM enzyme